MIRLLTLVRWFFCLVVYTCSCLSVQAQAPRHQYRVQMNSSPSEDRHWVQPLQDSSLLLISTKPGITTRKDYFMVSKLDYKLQPVWQKRFEQALQTQLLFVSTEESITYLLFRIRNTPSLVLYQITSTSGKAQYSYHKLPSDAIRLMAMAVTQGQVLLSARKEETHLLLGLTPGQNEAKLFPAVYGLHEKFTDFRTDELTRTAELAVAESTKHLSRLQLKTFSPQGEVLAHYFIPSRNQNNFLEARISSGDQHTKRLFGTYAYRNSEFSQGFFSSDLTGTTHFYSLAQLSNFYEHEDSKQLRKLKKTYDPVKDKDKPLKLRYQLLLHPVISHPYGFAVVGELYQLVYSKKPIQPQSRTVITNPNQTASPVSQDITENTFRPPVYANQVYKSYKYSAAMVLFFDKQGKLLWNNTLPLQKQKNTLSPNVTAAVTPDGKVIIAYTQAGNVHYKTINQNASSVFKDVIPIHSAFSGSKESSRTQDNLISWYGSHLLAYGFRRVSTKDQKEKSVLYLQSLSF